jgi:hypothetical protein
MLEHNWQRRSPSDQAHHKGAQIPSNNPFWLQRQIFNRHISLTQQLFCPDNNRFRRIGAPELKKFHLKKHGKIELECPRGQNLKALRLLKSTVDLLQCFRVLLYIVLQAFF